MSLTLHADLPPLRETDDGVIRIANTRISLERVVRAFQAGMTPEEISQNFDVLKIEDVYAVINYYLHHRSELDAYMADVEQDEAAVRAEVEKQFPAKGLRERLLMRRDSDEKK